MYKYSPPHPIAIKLTDELGFLLRQKVACNIEKNLSKGAERGSKEEQGFGALAETELNQLEKELKKKEFEGI